MSGLEYMSFVERETASDGLPPTPYAADVDPEFRAAAWGMWWAEVKRRNI